MVDTFDGILKQGRNRHGTLEFLVQLAGEYESTWEFRVNIPEKIVSPYFKK